MAQLNAFNLLTKKNALYVNQLECSHTASISNWYWTRNEEEKWEYCVVFCSNSSELLSIHCRYIQCVTLCSYALPLRSESMWTQWIKFDWLICFAQCVSPSQSLKVEQPMTARLKTLRTVQCGSYANWSLAEHVCSARSFPEGKIKAIQSNLPTWARWCQPGLYKSWFWSFPLRCDAQYVWWKQVLRINSEVATYQCFLHVSRTSQ